MTDDELQGLMGKVTPGPWFVSGVRVRLARQDTHAICAYDAAGKKDLNIANVWYDPKTNEGRADAALIAMAPDLAAEVLRLRAECAELVAANAQLVARETEVLVVIERIEDALGCECGETARAWLGGAK